MNHINHHLDIESTDDQLELFAEELELGESLQLCCYGCASSAACGGSCVSSFSTFSSECCDGS